MKSHEENQKGLFTQFFSKIQSLYKVKDISPFAYPKQAEQSEIAIFTGSY